MPHHFTIDPFHCDYKPANCTTMATLTAQPRFLRSITVDRAAKFSSEQFYSDINLYSQLYSKCSSEAIELSVYSVPDLKRIPFDEAVKQTFKPTTTGAQFGPSWVKYPGYMLRRQGVSCITL